MKRECTIRVESLRKIHLPERAPSQEEEVLREEWEDMLWQEGLPENTPVYSDRGGGGFLSSDLPSVLTAQGIFSAEKDGSFRISYEDTEITGLEGCMTTFCLAPTGMLILLRRGGSGTCMVFEEKHRHLCDYGSGAGTPSVTLHTHKLQADLKETGGSVSVDYSVEMSGIRTEHNELSIHVTLNPAR